MRVSRIAIKARDKNDVVLYPVMDGVYITFNVKDVMTRVLMSVFSNLSNLFLSETDDSKRFVVRAYIAYGDIIEGKDLTDDVTNDLETQYRSKLLLGLPIIQSFRGEKMAPPFGIYIHESARKFDDVFRLQGSTFKWWSDSRIAENMFAAINQYFDYCDYYKDLLNMESSKIDRYKGIAQAYFTDYKK